MANKIQVSSGGIGLGGVLFIVFLVLKLGVGNTMVQTWSWWWVTCPLWGPSAFILGIILISFIIVGIILLIGRFL